ncbi:MAG: hypothetical protein IAF38_06350 [Bacteroidia bacterium]|nr:hypothetical protein [Bacteroidia bacterium]
MEKKISYSLLIISAIVLFTFSLCKKDDNAGDPPQTNSPADPYADINNTYGFGLLNKIKGIWNGPVSSTTGLGSYPEWIVDFRPISENQISAKNELDTLNDIHMSYFIAKYNNQYRVCFRNGGSFGGQARVAYFLADSVSETTTQSFYRFTEVVNGKSRAYTTVIFRNDSLIMKTYTNVYNTLSTASLHMSWNAKLQDTTSCAAAVTNFNFPKKTLTKDFSSTFAMQTEAIYYSIGGSDPYTESQQPYLGQATINYTYAATYTPNASKKTFLIITTQPLFSGITFLAANLKYRSRYVVLSATDQSFVFNYMHPGTYYLYALYDADGNNVSSSGDWLSTTNTTFTLGAQGTATSSTQINFTIP